MSINVDERVHGRAEILGEAEVEITAPREREPRTVPLRAYLQERAAAGDNTATITQVQLHFDWTRKTATQTFNRVAEQDRLPRQQPGVYRLAPYKAKGRKSQDKAPEWSVFDRPDLQPKAEAPTGDQRYEVVDGVLAELFPNGVSVANLAEVVAWREATVKLLRLTRHVAALGGA